MGWDGDHAPPQDKRRHRCAQRPDAWPSMRMIPTWSANVGPVAEDPVALRLQRCEGRMDGDRRRTAAVADLQPPWGCPVPCPRGHGDARQAGDVDKAEEAAPPLDTGAAAAAPEACGAGSGHPCGDEPVDRLVAQAGVLEQPDGDRPAELLGREQVERLAVHAVAQPAQLVEVRGRGQVAGRNGPSAGTASRARQLVMASTCRSSTATCRSSPAGSVRSARVSTSVHSSSRRAAGTTNSSSSGCASGSRLRWPTGWLAVRPRRTWPPPGAGSCRPR